MNQTQLDSSIGISLVTVGLVYTHRVYHLGLVSTREMPDGESDVSYKRVEHVHLHCKVTLGEEGQEGGTGVLVLEKYITFPSMTKGA